MPKYAIGDLVTIQSIDGIQHHPGLLEFVKTPFVVEEVFDCGEFQGLALEGVPFILTDANVEAYNDD